MNNAIETIRISPCSAQSVELDKGDELIIIDPQGQQVSDLVAFERTNREEYLSSGRSLDYASRMWLTTGDILYSNRSRPMFTILEDTCGRHDFTLTPCSKDTFKIIYAKMKAARVVKEILLLHLRPTILVLIAYRLPLMCLCMWRLMQIQVSFKCYHR